MFGFLTSPPAVGSVGARTPGWRLSSSEYSASALPVWAASRCRRPGDFHRFRFFFLMMRNEIGPPIKATSTAAAIATIAGEIAGRLLLLIPELGSCSFAPRRSRLAAAYIISLCHYRFAVLYSFVSPPCYLSGGPLTRRQARKPDGYRLIFFLRTAANNQFAIEQTRAAVRYAPAFAPVTAAFHTADTNRGCETVVNGGSQNSDNAMLSKPTIDRSSGTFRPRRFASDKAPSAITSLWQKTADGQHRLPPAAAQHMAPASKVKLPRAI